MGRTEIGWQPEIVHANDWHTGLLPLLLAHEDGPRPATVFTLHNMAFQGNFPAHGAGRHWRSRGQLFAGGFEYYGQVSFLKAGVRFADRLTTVSPTYAREILTPEFGFGFEGLLQARNRRSDRHPQWRRLRHLGSRDRSLPAEQLRFRPA